VSSPTATQGILQDAPPKHTLLCRVQSENDRATAGVRNWKHWRNFKLRICSKTRPRESKAEADLSFGQEMGGRAPACTNDSFSGVESPRTREPHG
jgi:hypothetical protein